jgi:hypothetical protein
MQQILQGVSRCLSVSTRSGRRQLPHLVLHGRGAHYGQGANRTFLSPDLSPRPLLECKSLAVTGCWKCAANEHRE